MNSIALYVSVPVASFRVPRAREFFETFPMPPPATVYGMLLSMIGEIDRRAYEGTEIAFGLLSEPEYSVVLRTLWRVKNKSSGLGLGGNRQPDFQELLTDVQLAIWIRESVEGSLASKADMALKNPGAIRRFGGLALGESTHLVDEVRALSNTNRGVCQLLIMDDEGEMSLPIWADHVGSGTNWGQFTFSEFDLRVDEPLPENAWIRIERKTNLSDQNLSSGPQPDLFDKSNDLIL